MLRSRSALTMRTLGEVGRGESRFPRRLNVAAVGQRDESPAIGQRVHAKLMEARDAMYDGRSVIGWHCP